jgi:probable DNA metabolism protein
MRRSHSLISDPAQFDTALYDGSVDGFFSAVYESYTKKIKFEHFLSDNTLVRLTNSVYDVHTDVERSKQVQAGIRAKFPKRAQNNIYISFLYHENIALELYRYIIYGFSDPKHLQNITIPEVKKVEDAVRFVYKERARYYEFIRFSELNDGVMFASIEPKTNLISLLKTHFVDRFPNMDFIIYDELRALALVYLGHKISIEKVESIDELEFSDDEMKYRTLWQTFFDTIAIKERSNKKLQQQFVPLYYQKQMLEFN